MRLAVFSRLWFMIVMYIAWAVKLSWLENAYSHTTHRIFALRLFFNA